MASIHATIHDIQSEAYLLDAYGVFWLSNLQGLFPKSKETMQQLVLNGKIVGILSNSSQRARSEIQKIAKHGVVQGTHFHFLITSGEVAAITFKNKDLPFETPHNSFWVFGRDHPRYASYTALFEESCYTETAELEKADFIYISIPHINGEDQIDPEVFRNDVQKLVQTGLWMVCANPDRCAHEGSPPKLVVRQGSIAALYEEMGGKVFYIGKPHSLVYSHAMKCFQQYNIHLPSQVVMVGDTVETDIQGANAFQMKSALVLKTGITAERLKKQSLEAIIEKDPPNYLLEQF